jgi:hypothetical protein
MAHADTIPLSRMAGASINTAGVLGLLTNTGVTNADTLAGLDAFVDSIVLHADQRPYSSRVKLAWRVDAGITDSTVLGLTTVAGLTALTALGSDTVTQGLLPDN